MVRKIEGRERKGEGVEGGWGNDSTKERGKGEEEGGEGEVLLLKIEEP